MADFKTHVATSTLLGVGYGSAAAVGFGFTGVEGALACCVTGIGGMLPDLDSESGRPVREIFGLTAALAPMMLMRRLEHWGGTHEGAVLLAVLVYITIRYGGGIILGLLAVHRGMFHSIPALVIAAEATFLAYQSPSIRVKLLMAIGVAIGFASHLVLDEIYSVQWNGVRVKLKASAGSAVKLFGKSWAANVFTYGILFMLSYGILVDGGLLQQLDNSLPSNRNLPRAALDAELPAR